MKFLKLFNFFKPIMRAAYLKLSDETWIRSAIWDFWNFSTFSNPSWELLIWNFQMRLKTRYSIWNVWNLSNPSWGVAYLKLSDETWNEICYLKLFNPHRSWLFETFRWDMKWDMLFETFQPITGVGYLKLSDETWNEMCYLKLFNPSQELVIWSFQMRLKMTCAIWNFWNFSTFSNPSRELLIWNFQMRLE